MSRPNSQFSPSMASSLSRSVIARLSLFTLLASILVLSACGGGGGGSDAPAIGAGALPAGEGISGFWEGTISAGGYGYGYGGGGDACGGHLYEYPDGTFDGYFYQETGYYVYIGGTVSTTTDPITGLPVAALNIEDCTSNYVGASHTGVSCPGTWLGTGSATDDDLDCVLLGNDCGGPLTLTVSMERLDPTYQSVNNYAGFAGAWSGTITTTDPVTGLVIQDVTVWGATVTGEDPYFYYSSGSLVGEFNSGLPSPIGWEFEFENMNYDAGSQRFSGEIESDDPLGECDGNFNVTLDLVAGTIVIDGSGQEFCFPSGSITDMDISGTLTRLF